MSPKSKLIFCAVVSGILVSCNPAPKAPKFKKEETQSSVDEEPVEEKEKEIGETIKEGVDTDTYTKLTCANTTTRRGIRAWRRLSNSEIINTVRTVFAVNDTVDVSSLLSDVEKHTGFDTVQVEANFMDLNRMKGYVTFAQEVAKTVDVMKFLPCLPNGESCIESKLTELGSLAWRRPLKPDEITSYVGLYKGMVSEGGKPEEAFRFVIQALILSHNFMYRSELGTMNADHEFELTSWEIASALSYLIWRQPPDAQLRDLAAKDMLKTSEQIEKEANRLFADPKGKIGMAEFGEMWLVGKNILNVAKADAKFTDKVKENFSKEVTNFFVNTFFAAEKDTFESLLTSTSIPSDASSSFVYGSMPGADGQVKYKEEQRRGVLGQAGFLASHTYEEVGNPITRGAFISKRLLCVDFGEVPVVPVPEADLSLSNKERFAKHSTDLACRVCHDMLDPLGFAMEHFDVNGAFRAMDAGKSIVVNSKLTLDGKMVSASSPQELSKLIAESKQGLECFARQAFRYSYGRMEYSQRIILGGKNPKTDSVQSKLDQCEIDSTTADMEKSGGKLKPAMISFLTSPAFRIRLKGQIIAK